MTTITRLVAEGLFDREHTRNRTWEPLQPGVAVSWIYRLPDGPRAALLHYEPGARVPMHEHPGLEHILILEGSQEDADGVYPKGSCVIHGPGTRHSVLSQEGCLALAIWEKPVVFLPESGNWTRGWR